MSFVFPVFNYKRVVDVTKFSLHHFLKHFTGKALSVDLFIAIKRLFFPSACSLVNECKALRDQKLVNLPRISPPHLTINAFLLGFCDTGLKPFFSLLATLQ